RTPPSASFPTPVPVATDVEAPAVGTVIGERYRLEEELGGGAMGCVFRASVIAGGEDVAIKVIAPELVGRPGLVERLEREALLVQGVEHRAVRRVHEYGTTDDGVPFLVSELLEGESLDERLSREPALTAADMLQITIDILDGLEAVHAAGVVHRDLKPDNIFIDRDAAPKIIDFGVSKGALAGPALTTTGEILGTPVFMSPEQADHAKGATPAADVYGMATLRGAEPRHASVGGGLRRSRPAGRRAARGSFCPCRPRGPGHGQSTGRATDIGGRVRDESSGNPRGSQGRARSPGASPYGRAPA
ncbi:MAG: serine/threonine protein kinase, partial [Deltaproteobacteria bacterium]|nr:serine/threonine protein kinase [Deltaproteobacteria bacterium]